MKRKENLCNLRKRDIALERSSIRKTLIEKKQEKESKRMEKIDTMYKEHEKVRATIRMVAIV